MPPARARNGEASKPAPGETHIPCQGVGGGLTGAPRAGSRATTVQASLMLGIGSGLAGALRLLGGVEPIGRGDSRLRQHPQPVFGHGKPRRLVGRIPRAPRHLLALLCVRPVLVGLAHDR